MPFRLWDQLRDWVVLAVLLIGSVALMLLENQPMLRGLRATALETTSWVEARFAWAGHFFRALDENESLRQENITLSSELARLREAGAENERLRGMLAFRDSTDYPMVAARIINKDLYEDNLFTLDVGRVDSIKADMPVVDERGILGKVVFVSEHYSRVMPYLNTDFRVPAQIVELGLSGIVSWPGTGSGNLLLLDHIPKTEPARKGQLVVTSQFSGVFPKGYPVGIIDSVAFRPGQNELDILLRPAAPLDDAAYAFVILRTPDPEQIDLETRQVRRER